MRDCVVAELLLDPVVTLSLARRLYFGF